MSRISITSTLRIAAVVAVSILGFSSIAKAAPIGVFNDPGYVDPSTEGPNLINDLTSLGHTVSTFSGTSGGAWLSGIGSNSILVLPEMESGELQPALDAAAQTAIFDFVNAGGLLIQANFFPGNSSLPNALFGWSLSQSFGSGTSLNTTNAAGTVFAGGPGILSNADAVEYVSMASLPGGALSIYDDGTNSAVFTAQIGLGNYVYLGFDWFESPTPGDWFEVLNRATSIGPSAEVPEPGTLALLGLGLAGIGFTRRRRKG